MRADQEGQLTVEDIITRIARWLPHQGPIKEFIHHNTLHAFQHFDFHEGCLRASRLYGSWTYFPLAHYRRLYQIGSIDDGALQEVVEQTTSEFVISLHSAAPTGRASWSEVKAALLSPDLDEYVPLPGIADDGLRSRWRTEHQLQMGHLVHPVLFRLLGQYLDQGVAKWGAPHPECTFFGFIADLVKESWLPLWPFSNPRIRHYLEMTPAAVVANILPRFLGPDSFSLYERYLLEMCLSHPGWSGMVRELEMHPETLVEHRAISLLDFCALELMAEYDYVSQHLGSDFAPLAARYEPLPYESGYDLVETCAEQVAGLWHKAFERTYRQRFLRQLDWPARSSQAAPRQPVEVQAYFCLDDREGSLRRHLEAQEISVETFGFAGFFGVDCVYQGIDDAFPSKHCPAPIHPKHRIREQRSNARQDARSLRRAEGHGGPQTLVRGFVISQTLGLWAAVKLALSIFRPSLNPLATSSLHHVDSDATLAIHRTQDKVDEDGFFSGYSDSEMADRVGNILSASGLTVGAPAGLIVFVGHGASSVNNPYFAAYDCGACSGKAGGPNARAIALMANRPEVRAVLKTRGLDLPSTTWFLGALHDTTRDEMQYFDLQSLPETHQGLFGRFQAAMDGAVALNAKERCQRFANVSPRIDPRDAILAVRRRSVSFFEPRPELNHATNAVCVVGRRNLTRGLDLNRRCFLNSYDPTLDPTGEILTSLLSAVVPVCGGINLEYYFSRMDPNRYGAGSKLPHNIQALIGVINGTDGDLLTGLPTQMTEVHDPFRLLLIVEQTSELALKAATHNAEIYEWIERGWIQYLCLDLSSGHACEFRQGEMVPLPLVDQSVTAAATL